MLDDLAFVLMDLWHRGRPDLANRLFNRYLDETDEAPDAGLMPVLMSLRAVIRAHVTASQAAAFAHHAPTGEGAAMGATALRGEAMASLALARDLLAETERPPRLVAVGVLSEPARRRSRRPWLPVSARPRAPGS